METFGDYQKEINIIAKRHKLLTQWVKSPYTNTIRLWISFPHSDWIDTTICFLPETKEWTTDLCYLKDWKKLNRTRTIAQKARPYWKKIKPFFQEVLALFGVQM